MVSRESKLKWIVTQFRVNGIGGISLSIHRTPSILAIIWCRIHPKYNNNCSIAVFFSTLHNYPSIHLGLNLYGCVRIYDCILFRTVAFFFGRMPSTSSLHARMSVTYQSPFSLQRLIIIIARLMWTFIIIEPCLYIRWLGGSSMCYSRAIAKQQHTAARTEKTKCNKISGQKTSLN